MASQHIEIQGTAGRLSSDVRRMIDNLRSVQDLYVKSKAIMDQVASSSDWATLATYLGTDTTEAEAIYNLLTAALGDITTAEIQAVLDRLG